MTNKKSAVRKITIGSIIALLIALTPYLFYSYEYFPEEKEWETVFGVIESKGFVTVYLYAWYLTSKVVPIFLLVLWFFTCKHWWYHVILIPLAMYIFQLFTVINIASEYIDEVEIIYLIPIMMIIIPFVYLIRLKLFDKLVYGIDIKKLDEELERLKDMEDLPDDSLDIK